MEEDPRWATVAPPEHLESCRVSHVLDTNHQSVFAIAMSNLLSTEIAEQTFAQIVDGLPLRDVAFGLRYPEYTRHDPVFAHAELCPGVLEKTRLFRESFDPKAMELRTNVLQRYQDVPAGSRASKLPLLELIAVATHTIAADLFELDGALHKRDTPCSSSRDDEDEINRIPPWPTTFAVHSYAYTEQFPRGVADVAGYWAEDIIFGGVVLFGRGESGTGYDGVWYHSHRKSVTFRIYALIDEQLESLLHFLEWVPKSHSNQEGQRPECPLPILGDRNNRTRVDPDIAIPLHSVFRDRWEQKIWWKSYSAYSWSKVKGRPKNEIDYPELGDRLRRSQGGPRYSANDDRARRTLGDFMKRNKNHKDFDPQSGT